MDELDSNDQSIYNGVEYNFVQVVFLLNGQELRPQIKLDGVAYELFGYQKFRRDRHHPFTRLELIPNGGRIVVLVGEAFEEAETVLPGPNYPTGIVNVKAYGAAGDGVTDDTALIQAAATAAAGNTLRFPKGNYRLSGHINLSSNTRVEADSSVTITQVTPGEIVFYGSSVSKVSIDGFTLIGPGSAYRPLLGDTAGAIFFDGDGGGHLVENCTVSGFWNGISAVFQAGFTARECDVTAWRIYGILASVTDDFHIDHNRVHGNDTPIAAAWSGATTYGLGDTATNGGLFWTSLHANNLNNVPPGAPPGDAHWYATATYCVMATGGRSSGLLQSRNSISFNELRDNPVWDGVMSHDCDGLRIVCNEIRNVRMGLDLGANAAGNFVDKIVAIGNYIEGTSTDSWSGVAASNRGISVSGLDAATAARNVTVSSNVISNFGLFNPGASIQGGVVLVYAIGVSVIGNRIFGIGPNPFNANLIAGIALNQIAQYITIVGNDVQTDINVAAGIYVLNVAVTNGITISANCVLSGNLLPSILLSTVTGDIVAITGNSLRDGNNTATAVRVASCTLTQLNVAGNATSSALPYRATGSTITREYVDWVRQVNLTLVATSNLTNQTPTITTGFGAPTTDEPIGSLYLSGSTAPNLYVKTAAGAAGWTAK